MLIQVVLFTWVATVFVTSGTELHPMKPDDLRSLVESVKNDIDQHLQLMSDRLELTSEGQTSVEESTVSQEPSTESDAVLHESSIDDHSEDLSEYLSDGYKIYYGAVKGIPGFDFPDYTDIPKTSFTCSDKHKFPGFYADMDTGCQIFHVCWPDCMESFLCPVGTIFNQELLTCDYWYNFKCSMAPYYYPKDSQLESDSSKFVKVPVIEAPVEKSYPWRGRDPTPSVKSFVSELMPVKAKVVYYPQAAKLRAKIAASGQVAVKQPEGVETISLQKSRASKHYRIPRSLEYASSYTSSQKELKDKIFKYRFWEALNNAVTDMKNNKSTVHLIPYAERVLEFFKKDLFENELPEMINVEPGTELYEYDVCMKEDADYIKELAVFTAETLHYFDSRSKEKESKKHEVSIEDDKTKTLKHTPLTKLNPRFIVKPDVRKFKIEERGKLSTLARFRRTAAALDLSDISQEDLESIHPETKERLLKNYVKLYKIKHA